MVLLGLAGLMVLALWGARRWAQAKAERGLRLSVPPGIDERRFVRLGGVEQWVTIRGEDARNPALLILHGGPGAPHTMFTPDLRSWERDFTLVQWDRAGVGKTFARNGKTPLRFERQVEDALELRAELERRLPGRPVVLLSSSAGTMVALPLVQRRPELFAAWVGTDFNPGLAACERVAMPATLAWARAKGTRAEVAFLEQAAANTSWDLATWNRLMRLRDKTAREGLGAIFPPRMVRAPDYGVLDFVAILRGLEFSTAQLLPQMQAFDAHAVSALKLPTFIFQGEEDVATPASVAQAWYEALEAPQKHFALLPGVGHLGGFVHPALLLELLQRHVRPVAVRGER
jgi:pimeloyl-ACP methyl ester carboxylesterase